MDRAAGIHPEPGVASQLQPRLTTAQGQRVRFAGGLTDRPDHPEVADRRARRGRRRARRRSRDGRGAPPTMRGQARRSRRRRRRHPRSGGPLQPVTRRSSRGSRGGSGRRQRFLEYGDVLVDTRDDQGGILRGVIPAPEGDGRRPRGEIRGKPRPRRSSSGRPGAPGLPRTEG